MNVQTLYETLVELERIDKALQLQTRLQAIASSLESLVQAPAQPQTQSALASALEQFIESCSKLPDNISPSRMTVVRSIGGGDFFDAGLAEKVRKSIAENAMTPSVAHKFVKEILVTREAFLENVISTRKGLERLHVQTDATQVQAPVEVSFLIPRNLFDNSLGDFAKELHFINRMLMDLEEATSGQRKKIEVDRLSTSNPTVVLAAGMGAMLWLGKIVEKFLDIWKKAEEIREIRARLKKIGVSSTTALDELTTEIKKNIETAADESVKEIMQQSPLPDIPRRNELQGFLKNDTLKLYFQIERGLNVEIKVNSDVPAADAKLEDITQLKAMSVKLQYPQIIGEPILSLPPGVDVDESSYSDDSDGSTSTATAGKKGKKAKAKPETGTATPKNA